jgi:TetR/AcrR family transcriptional regulator, transcriptional repressor of bet genes
MPRPPTITVDDLTDALIRVVVARGLDAVSIREVAREAGVSIGAVQHYFATKDDLLLAAYTRAIDQVVARARDLPQEPAAYVRGLLRELLPLDAQREAELRVALAFTARSVHNPRLAELYEAGYAALVDAVAGVLGHQAATEAVAVADGLAWHSLCAPDVLSPDAAAAALEAYLTRVVT